MRSDIHKLFSSGDLTTHTNGGCSRGMISKAFLISDREKTINRISLVFVLLVLSSWRNIVYMY